MFRGIDRGGVHRGMTRRTHPARLLIAGATLALATGVAGCGSTQPLTRAQLVSKADKICAQVHDRVRAVGPAKTPQQLSVLAHKLAGFEQQQIESMRKLKPPASLASDWKQMVEGAQEIAEDAGTLSTDLQLKKEKQAGEALKQIGKVEQRLDPIVKRDGFSSCNELN